MELIQLRLRGFVSLNLDLFKPIFFHHLVVSKNRGTPKWMLYNRNPLLKWMIWRFSPYFWKHPFGEICFTLSRHLKQIQVKTASLPLKIGPTCPPKGNAKVYPLCHELFQVFRGQVCLLFRSAGVPRTSQTFTPLFW